MAAPYLTNLCQPAAVSNVNCPECQDHLVAKTLKPSNVQIDVCPSCNGAWFDAGEMPDVLSVATQNLKPPAKARPSLRMCPKGCKRMRAFYYPQTKVLIDLCPDCLGLWLDPGEFAEIREVRRHLETTGQLEAEKDSLGEKLFGWIHTAVKAFGDGK